MKLLLKNNVIPDDQSSHTRIYNIHHMKKSSHYMYCIKVEWVYESQID